MKRREFIKTFGSTVALCGAWAGPRSARGQLQIISVIGLLTATNVPDWHLRSIQKGLSEGGYTEGRNLTIMYRSADGQFDRLPALAADIAGSKVSVIFAVGGPIPAR